MELLIEILSHDRNLVAEILGLQQKSSNLKTASIPGDAIITKKESFTRKAFGGLEILEFLLSFGSAVASGVVANYIFQKINGKASSLRIDHIEIEINEQEIKKVIIEKIKESSKHE